MQKKYLLPFGAILALIAIVCAAKLMHLRVSVGGDAEEVRALRDSVAKLATEVRASSALAPGLGEYMSAMQLHVGKLWYAAAAENWRLAEYEVNELSEAVDGAIATHTIRDSIKVSEVLAAMKPLLLDSLGEGVKSRNVGVFQVAYTGSLSRCNACHSSLGYPFIKIIEPWGPPVTNQEWSVQDSTRMERKVDRLRREK